MTHELPPQVIIDAGQAATSTADVSALAFLSPIFAFLAVFVIMFALLMKTKLLGDDSHPWINLFVSFIIGILFVAVSPLREFVLIVVPWFAILLLGIFFIMVLVGLMGKTDDVIGKGLAWFFIIILIGIFVVSGAFVFSDNIFPYLPGPDFGIDGDPETLVFFSWLYSPKVSGAILLLVLAGAVGFVLIKFTGDST